jgi:hypothetical protein
VEIGLSRITTRIPVMSIKLKTFKIFSKSYFLLVIRFHRIFAGGKYTMMGKICRINYIFLILLINKIYIYHEIKKDTLFQSGMWTAQLHVFENIFDWID